MRPLCNTRPVFKTGTTTGACVPSLLEGEGLGFSPGPCDERISYHKNLNQKIRKRLKSY